MNQSRCFSCFTSTNQSLFLCLTVKVLENTAAIECQQHRFPDGGAEPRTKNSFGFYHNSTAQFIIWCLATRPNNWIVCCKRSNESFGKKGAHWHRCHFAAYPSIELLAPGWDFQDIRSKSWQGSSRKSPKLIWSGDNPQDGNMLIHFF